MRPCLSGRLCCSLHVCTFLNPISLSHIFRKKTRKTVPFVATRLSFQLRVYHVLKHKCLYVYMYGNAYICACVIRAVFRMKSHPELFSQEVSVTFRRCTSPTHSLWITVFSVLKELLRDRVWQRQIC